MSPKKAWGDVFMKAAANSQSLAAAVNLAELQGLVIDVGFFADTDSRLCIIAGVQEFGAAIRVTDRMRGWLAVNGLRLKKSTEVIRVPETAFMRRGYDRYVGSELVQHLENEVEAVIFQGRTAATVGNRIGDALRSSIQRAIDETDGPPLHPFTLARRIKGRGDGQPQRLRDTGRLRGAVTYRVSRGTKKEGGG